jgi:autotransporter-associated beta strand protein
MIRPNASLRPLKKTVAVIATLSFLASQGFAQSYSVTTTAGDSSAGSLGAALSSASGDGATASDTVGFGSVFGSNQTVTLTSSYSSVVKNSGQSLALNSPAPSALLTLNGGGNTLFNFSGGGQLVLDNIALTNGSIAISGAGTTLAANSNISATLNLTAATLQASSALAVSGPVAISGGAVIDTHDENVSVSGVVSGTGGLNVVSNDFLGGGLLTLSAGNTYSGGTTVGGFTTLAIAGDSSLGASSGGLTLDGGSVQTLANLTSARSVTLSGGGTLDADGNSATLSGVVSGTGGLNVQSTTAGGTLTLSGSNTYTGGTTVGAGATLAISADGNLGAASGGLTLNGGTLETTASVTSARNVTLNGGGTIFASGPYGTDESNTFSGVISGTGGLNLVSYSEGLGYHANDGTISLTGVNTYTGGTTIGANLQVFISNTNNLGALSGGLIMDGGQLRGGATIDRSITLNTAYNVISGAFTLNGLISGTGGFTTYGTITVNNGANSYSGVTQITSLLITPVIPEARVIVGASGALGTGAVGLYSATLQPSSSMTLANAINIDGSYANVIDVAGNDLTLTGALTGAAGQDLQVESSVGDGTLTLSGSNNIPQMEVVSGTLSLGAAGAAGDSGTSLTVDGGAAFKTNGLAQTLGSLTNNGTVHTGAGTLTLTGNYAGGGTLAVIPTLSGPNLSVGGSANLTGGTLQVEGHPASGDYTIISGALGGTTFSGATLLPPGYTLNAEIYNANSLILDLTAGGNFTAAGQSANQAAVGSVLNALNGTAPAGSDLANVLGQLGVLPQSQINTALDQISPISLAAMRGLVRAGSDAAESAIGQRLSGLQAGTANRDGARVEFFDASGESGYQHAMVQDDDFPEASRAPRAEAAPSDSTWSYFASVLGTAGRLDAIDGAAGVQPGYRFTNAGASLGADYRFNDHFVAGLTAGYVDGAATVTDGSSLSSESVRAGVYGTVYGENLHANLYLGVARDFYDVNQNMELIGRAATASPQGRELNGDASAGYDLKSDLATFSPFVGAGYDRVLIDGFTENGAGSMDETIGSQTQDSLRSRVGIKISRKIDSGDRFFVPFLSAAWEHEYMSQSEALSAQFAGTPLSPFTTNTADPSRDGALVGAGLDAEWGKTISTRLAYSGDFRSDFYANTVSGSVRLKF